MRQSLPRILRHVGQEIARAGAQAALLQDDLGHAPRDEAGIVALQSLDALTQHLSGIADFLAALAPVLPADCEPDIAAALRAVPLSALAERLMTGCPERPARPDFELELFGEETA